MLLDSEDSIFVADRPLWRLRYHIQARVYLAEFRLSGLDLMSRLHIALEPIGGVAPGALRLRTREFSLSRIRELSQIYSSWKLLQAIERVSAPRISFQEFILRSMRDQSTVSITFMPDVETLPGVLLRLGSVHLICSLPPVATRQFDEYFYEKGCADD